MKLKLRKKTSDRLAARLTKKVRIRKTVKGTPERPRLCVYRSNTNIYAQIIDDTTGTTILALSSQSLELKETGKEAAKIVGAKVAEAALKQKIKNVVFDRNGFIYHGRIQAVADGAREAGLNF